MKLSFTLSFIIPLLTCIDLANAQTPVYICGSTAFRKTAHRAIRNNLAAGYTYAFTGSSIDTATQAVFKGTMGVNSVEIYTTWNGSVAGIKALAVTGAEEAGVRPMFIPSTVTTLSIPGNPGVAAGTDIHTADMAFSDCLQSSTPFRAVYPLTNRNLESSFYHRQVAVVPFKFVSSYSVGSFINPITNMTTRLASLLYSNGDLPVALWTGNAADQGKFIYGTGFNPDSGTRVITLSETGYGSLGSLLQYQPAFSGTSISSQVPFPAVALNTSTGTALPAGWSEGNGGFSNPVALADSMRYTTSAIGGFYLTGLGLLDAKRATSATGAGAGPAKELTWNGVPYSFTNVVEGTYTFWGYEYLYTRLLPNSLNSTIYSPGYSVKSNVAQILGENVSSLPPTPLADQISAETINLSDMHVVRSGDGGDVSNDY